MFQRWFGRGAAADAPAIDRGLEKTRRGLLGSLAAAFRSVDITESTWDDLEGVLIAADVGPAAAGELLAALRNEAKKRGLRRADELPRAMARIMIEALRSAQVGAPDGGCETMPGAASRGPVVMLVVGVNGGGKTTSIAKLASLYRDAGRSVVLVAADTFRAAAVEQLKTWGERCDVPVIAGQQDGDPGAVVFDALASTAARQADVVIVDTAGRLHTQGNLMSELTKIRRVAGRVVPGAPHETLLVLDATTGQNGLAQAKAFLTAVDVTGLILAKLDSSAKGGVAFAIARELGTPIRFVGTGESVGDLAPFDAESYVHGLLGIAGSDPASAATTGD